MIERYNDMNDKEERKIGNLAFLLYRSYRCIVSIVTRVAILVSYG